MGRESTAADTVARVPHRKELEETRIRTRAVEEPAAERSPSLNTPTV